MTEHPGTIGETYECRRPDKDGVKKRGVLESVDDKCKTLMMRDADGNSFTITFSTFRSNYRKYKGEDVVKTSTQVEEEKEEQEKEVEQAKKEIKRKPKDDGKLKGDELYKAVHNAQVIVENVVKQENDSLLVKVTKRGGVNLKLKNMTYVEFWADFVDSIFMLAVREEFLPYIKDNVSEDNKDLVEKAVYKKGWKMKYCIQPIELDRLENVAVDMVKALTAVQDRYQSTEQNEDEEEEQ